MIGLDPAEETVEGVKTVWNGLWPDNANLPLSAVKSERPL